MSDPTNPDHYKRSASGIECIEVTRHMSFNLGNAMKYIWRAPEKFSNATMCPNEAVVVDLRKAIWYIQDEIVRLGGDPNVERKLRASSSESKAGSFEAVGAWPPPGDR